jgi:hypothetical protein
MAEVEKRQQWIRMRPHLAVDPDVVRIAQLVQRSGGLPAGLSIEIAVDIVVSRLLRVWGAVHNHAEDGVLRGYGADSVDALASLPGLAEALVEVNWLCIRAEGAEFPDVGRYIGSAKGSRARWRGQKRSQRHAPSGRSAAQSVAVPEVVREDNSVDSARKDKKKPAGPSASDSVSGSGEADGSKSEVTISAPPKPNELVWMSDERWRDDFAAVVRHALSKTRLRRLDAEVIRSGVTCALVTVLGDRTEDDSLPADQRDQQRRMRRDPAFCPGVQVITNWIDDLARRGAGKSSKYLAAAFNGGPTNFKERTYE